MSNITEWKEKRKKALIAICTLGLSEAPWSMLYNNSKDIDNGFSFEGGSLGFAFRVSWFIFWTLLTSAIMWVINIFKFLNYHISIVQYNKKHSTKY